MINNKKYRVGSEAQYGPRTVGEILHDFLENSDEPLAVAFRHRKAYANTELCVDLKLLKQKPGRLRVGKCLEGILAHDGEEHFTFIETLPQGAAKRNPHVYEGEFITVTRRSDGSLRPNFKNLTTGRGFSVESYAFGVACELREALSSLIEED